MNKNDENILFFVGGIGVGIFVMLIVFLVVI